VITSQEFRKATGRDPAQDDLERCNCKYAGKLGHSDCGWNKEHNLPNFMANYLNVKLSRQ
jgi:hypothetical protein